MKHKYLFTLLFLFLTTGAKAQTIFTVAGDSTRGYNGDTLPAVQCELNDPIGVAVDSAGNIYFSDRDNNRICKVNLSGFMTTIAGTGVAGFSGDGGPATSAEIHWPYGVAVDKSGNVYFADAVNARVRKINSTGIITTVAGTDTAGYNGDEIAATAAELNVPTGVAVDGNDNIYIADGRNNRIRNINTSGIITTYVGNGTSGSGYNNVPATAAEIYDPYGIAVDNMGNLYFACYNAASVYKVNTSGILNIIAGAGTTGYSGDGGPATAALLSAVAVAVDISSNVYIADPVHSVVRMVNTEGIISTIAGTGVGFYNGDNKPATDADLYEPTGIAVDANGSVYIADFANNRIRYVQNTLSVKNVTNTATSGIVYPNPNQGNFFTKIISDDNEPILLSVRSTLGEVVKEINAITNQQIEIQLENAPPGIYFLSASCADGDWSGRIIISP